jgi:L-asparaginase
MARPEDAALRPRVALISTGGTIASVDSDCFNLIDYPDTARKIEAPEILARFPEAGRFAEVIPVPFIAKSSTAVGIAEMLALNELIHELPGRIADLAGIVVSHGTATLEETAYFLSLVVKLRIPVVMVGAQKPLSAFGSDAGPNLVAAIRAAISREVEGLGVLIVLNDEIHAPRDASKTSTYRLQTFRSPEFGVLGSVDGDGVQIYRRSTRAHAPDTEFDLRGRQALPRVDIVLSYAGSDATAVRAYRAAGARGLVSAGLAPGLATPAERLALEEAASVGVVVVQTTRAGSGRVSRRAYLQRHGMVAGDNLTPQKARILLSVALAHSSDAEQIQAWFARY